MFWNKRHFSYFWSFLFKHWGPVEKKMKEPKYTITKHGFHLFENRELGRQNKIEKSMHLRSESINRNLKSGVYEL